MLGSPFLYGNQDCLSFGEGGGGGGVTPEQLEELKNEILAKLAETNSELANVKIDAKMGSNLANNLSKEISFDKQCYTLVERGERHEYIDDNFTLFLSNYMTIPSTCTIHIEAGAMLPFEFKLYVDGNEYSNIGSGEGIDAKISLNKENITVDCNTGFYTYQYRDKNPVVKVIGQGMGPWLDMVWVNTKTVKPTHPDEGVQILSNPTTVTRGQKKRVKLFNSSTHYYSDLSFDSTPTEILLEDNNIGFKGYLYLPEGVHNIRVGFRENIKPDGTIASTIVIRNYGDTPTTTYLEYNTNVRFSDRNVYMTFAFDTVAVIRSEYVNMNP